MKAMTREKCDSADVRIEQKRRRTMTREETMNTNEERLHRRPVDGDVRRQGSPGAMKVCIVGASGKLGQYMVQHALDLGYEVVGVCREKSVGKLDAFEGRITVVPGATNDPEVIKRAVAGCDGVLVVLVPWGVHGYSTGTAQAVLDHAPPDARLVFSCGWHITLDGQDVYSWKLKALVKVFGPLARLARFADLDDQVEACRRVFASDTRWTVVRGSDLEEGESQGLPVWSRHVGDPILASNLTRRVDFALFMVAAIENDELVHEAPAIVGCRTPSALAHAAIGESMSPISA
jgi:NAD(P)-dependent dehydrogenase (short-subunit alcohol dehydrogenase family)